MGILPNPKRAAQDKVAEIKGSVRAKTIGRVENAVEAVSGIPVLRGGIVECTACHHRGPKNRKKSYGIGGNKWICRNTRKCNKRKGYSHTHPRLGTKNQPYPPWWDEE